MELLFYVSDLLLFCRTTIAEIYVTRSSCTECLSSYLKGVVLGHARLVNNTDSCFPANRDIQKNTTL